MRIAANAAPDQNDRMPILALRFPALRLVLGGVATPSFRASALISVKQGPAQPRRIAIIPKRGAFVCPAFCCKTRSVTSRATATAPCATPSTATRAKVIST